MAENGRLSPSELSPIPGGQLRHDAAAAWNAPGGPADAGLRPGGPDSSYRTYDRQVYWKNYWTERGLPGNAATPGYSNHGLGIAVDLPNAWEQEWMRENGAKYGWAKTEAFSEPWHWTFVGGVSFPTFKTLRHGMRGPRVVKFTRRLAFIHKRGGRPYLARQHWKFKDEVVDSVRAFQKAYRLTVDGEIGPKTAAKINAVFHRQHAERGKS